MFPSIVALRWGRDTGRPVVVSPHGMLDPWALRNSRLKKAAAWSLFEGANLRRASCLHALNQAELAAVRRLGLNNPVCVIPNGVDLPEDAPPGTPPWAGTVAHGRKVMVHLGRYHRKKNLAALVEGWARMTGEHRELAGEWALVLAGWDQEGAMAQLRRLVASHSLDNSVLLLGPQYGEAKRSLLANAQAFVLPSLSEGLPVAALEAWSFGLPVLMTAESNLPEGFEAGAAMSTPVDPEGIAVALADFLARSDQERRTMGGCGRRMVEERYSWKRVVDDMADVYSWLFGGGPPPASVDLGSV